jgi:glycosyltransferase involved in cell wall biosynthesis
VGSFYDIKGTDLLIEALNKFSNENLKVVLIGSGNYGKELNHLSSVIDLKIIDGLDQKEINTFYNRSRFFVFPSRSEGFGLSLAEAMYCGTPGIISDLEQLKYQVTEGWNGYIFQNTTSQSLANVIKKATSISSEKWDELSQNARKRTEEYTLDHVCSSLQRIYTGND